MIDVSFHEFTLADLADLLGWILEVIYFRICHGFRLKRETGMIITQNYI